MGEAGRSDDWSGGGWEERGRSDAWEGKTAERVRGWEKQGGQITGVRGWEERGRSDARGGMGREGQAEVRCKEEIETGEMGKTG